MNSAKLAKLLIEGPRIVEDVPGALALTQHTTDMSGSRRSGLDSTDSDEQGYNDDDQQPKIDKKVAVFLNRAILRIFSVPSLMTFLKDVVLFADTQAKDGQCRIQFVFHRLPEEAHPMLVKLIAAPDDPKFTRFVDKGQARTGVELEVSPEDFGGEEYDYAF